jgi:hypothetical protein
MKNRVQRPQFKYKFYKAFFSVSNGQVKLNLFCSDQIFQASLIFESKPRGYLSGALAQLLIGKYWTSPKNLEGTNNSTYFALQQ